MATWALIAVTVFFFPAAVRAADEEGCSFCHNLPIKGVVSRAVCDLRVADPQGAVHSTLFCSDCHTDIKLIPHAGSVSPARCLDSCHAAADQTVQAKHRAASFGGLTESHRKISAPSSPCALCHASSDGKGDKAAIGRRCASCHKEVFLSLASGIHRDLAASGAEGCVACHKAHGDGSAKPVPVSCSGCHDKVTDAMRALGGHR